MNAFRFSDNLPTTNLSEFEKNNFSNMQMLKSIYDDSFDVANDFFRNGMEGFKSSAKKAYEKSKDSAKKSAKEVKKADKAVKDSAKKVNDAKKKVDAAKQDAAKKVEDAKQEVQEAKEEQQEAKEEAQEAKEEAKEAQDDADDAEEVATVAEGDEEGFYNYSDSDEEGFDDDDDAYIEGMKSKKKSSKKKSSKKKSSKKKSSKKKSSKKKSSSKKYTETIPSPDLIGWAVQKANGTKNDEKLVKSILNSLFVTFLSFLIAHNWYYNFFVNPTKFRLEESLSFLKENEFIHFFTIYTVQIIASIENFIMENIPGKINFMIKYTPLGKRSVFYFILSASLASVPYFLKQLKFIFEYLRKQINRLIYALGPNSSKNSIRDFLQDLVSKGFDSIFAFKGIPFLSGMIGLLFVVKYMGNIIIDHSKGLVENVTEIIPSFVAKLLSGTIFYVIYLVFKFAIFYQPTIAFSSFIIAVYLFYFSIVRLIWQTGFFGAFSVISENIKHMNDGKVLFDRDVFSKYRNKIEETCRFIMENAHQIFLLFTLKLNVGSLLNIESKMFKTTLLTAGITGALKLLYSVLEKYGIGESEVQIVGNEFEELSKEIKENIEKHDLKKTSAIETMFERIYKPYKSV